MRNFIILFGSAAALGAVPASAQLAGTVGGAVTGTAGAVTSLVNANAQTRVDTTVNTRIDTAPVLDSAGRVVDHTHHAVDRAVTTSGNSGSVTLVTREQVRPGLVVRDKRGQRIGTVARVEGNQAVVVSGNRLYRVPLLALYRRTTGAANGLVSSIPRAQLTARVNAKASTGSAVNGGN